MKRRCFKGYAVLERPDGSLAWGTFRPTEPEAQAVWETWNPPVPGSPQRAIIVQVSILLGKSD
jgi:hypothetical protein